MADWGGRAVEKNWISAVHAGKAPRLEATRKNLQVIFVKRVA